MFHRTSLALADIPNYQRYLCFDSLFNTLCCYWRPDSKVSTYSNGISCDMYVGEISRNKDRRSRSSSFSHCIAYVRKDRLSQVCLPGLLGICSANDLRSYKILADTWSSVADIQCFTIINGLLGMKTVFMLEEVHMISSPIVLRPTFPVCL